MTDRPVQARRMSERQVQARGAVLHIVKFVFACCVTGVFSVAWGSFYLQGMRMPFHVTGNWAMLALYLCLYVVFARLYGGFEAGNSRVSELIYSQVIALLFTNAVAYVVICLLSYRPVNPLPLLAVAAVSMVLGVAFSTLANRLYNRLFPPKKTVVVYDYLDEMSAVGQISKLSWKFEIVDAVCMTRGMDEVLRAVDRAEAVFICGASSKARNAILKHCVDRGIHVYLRPKIGDLLVSSAKEMQLNNLLVLHCSRARTTFWYVAAKRLMDIVASLLGLVVASPFMLVTALAIKLYDHGPVLYRQCRLTKDGREFYILKFRSIRQDAEKDGVARLASEHDDRITPVGKLIRAIRFDELPQLLNILKGDMSLVGPRPERPEIAAQYEQEMPEFRLRLQAKAGLTGYAQVHGKYNSTPYDKLQMDLVYIANQSIVQDMKLIFETIKILFMKESTEGVAEGQKTAAMRAERR